MSDRTDQKLDSVKLAEYRYRHEAEFAAGFLDDAGIPYRLQLDDAAMGMTVGVPATLWVRGMDERAAREVLDLPVRTLAPRRASSAAPRLPGGTGGPPPSVRPPAGVGARAAVRPRDRDLLLPPERSPGPRPPAQRDLSDFERTLAFALFVACLGAVPAALAAPAAPVWVAVIAAVAGPLGMGALAGRTIEPVRRLLRAISGTAP